MSEVKLPEGWCFAKIEEVSAKCSQRIPQSDESFTYVDIGSINRELKVIESPQYLLGETAPSRARKSIEEGDILVSLTRPNLNAVALVTKEYNGQIASTGFEVIKPILVDSRYIFSITRSKHFIDEISGAVQGALYPAAKSGDVQKYKLPLPPLAEQKVIADKLETLLAQVGSAKARLEEIPHILKRFRQAVLVAAVSGYLTEEWRAQNPEQTCTKVVSLGDIIIDGPQNGIYKPSSLYGSGHKIVRIDSFYEGVLSDWNTFKRVQLERSEVEKWSLRNNDILINRVNSIEYLGKCGLVENLPEVTVFESNIMRITLNSEKAVAKFVTIFLSSILGLSRLRENAKLAVNQASINQKDVKSCKIELPCISEQTEIVRRVEQFFAYADTIEKHVQNVLERVNNLTQSILSKAVRGEFTAQWRAENPDLISGENSAQALLEKIQQQRISKKNIKRNKGNS